METDMICLKTISWTFTVRLGKPTKKPHVGQPVTRPIKSRYFPDTILQQRSATCVPPQGCRCAANFYKKLRISTL
jgi:hypothetical protein